MMCCFGEITGSSFIVQIELCICLWLVYIHWYWTELQYFSTEHVWNI